MMPVRVFDAEGGEGHDALVARATDPDQAVLLVHFAGDVPQPVLILTKHFGNAGDGMDVMNLVDLGHDQAAAGDDYGGRPHCLARNAVGRKLDASKNLAVLAGS
jgi:hypothetical protein